MLSAKQPVAMITGASKRIGKALAENFHRLGYDIIIHYNQGEDAALELSAKLNEQRPESATLVQANLEEKGEIERLTIDVGHITTRLDLLINNASIFAPDTAEPIEQWDAAMNINARSCLQVCNSLKPLLKATQGAIINFVDIYADRPLRDHTIYSTSKAAIAMLTKSLAIELAPEIRVNGISPGAILWPENDMNDHAKQVLISKIPLGRIGSTQAIIDTANFLTQCDYITGQIIKVDGGRSVTI